MRRSASEREPVGAGPSSHYLRAAYTSRSDARSCDTNQATRKITPQPLGGGASDYWERRGVLEHPPWITLYVCDMRVHSVTPRPGGESAEWPSSRRPGCTESELVGVQVGAADRNIRFSNSTPSSVFTCDVTTFFEKTYILFRISSQQKSFRELDENLPNRGY